MFRPRPDSSQTSHRLASFAGLKPAGFAARAEALIKDRSYARTQRSNVEHARRDQFWSAALHFRAQKFKGKHKNQPPSRKISERVLKLLSKSVKGKQQYRKRKLEVRAYLSPGIRLVYHSVLSCIRKGYTLLKYRDLLACVVICNSLIQLSSDTPWKGATLSLQRSHKRRRLTAVLCASLLLTFW